MDAPSRPGCLLFAIPRALVGRRPAAALPDGLALPDLDTAKVDPVDLPALIRARNAARRCHERIVRADVSSVATRDAGRELVGWVTRIYAMGPALRDARAFVVVHAPDKVARERAELELELIAGTPEQARELAAAMKALDRRSQHAQVVRAEVDRLAARLVTAAAELEAFDARLGAAAPFGDLVHEARAWQQSATLAIEAFATTVGEVALPEARPAGAAPRSAAGKAR